MFRAETPELWGGLECTVARIGDRYRDQTAETGHDARPGDLDLVASLGVRRLRYPVLWEAVSPAGAPLRGWDWHDRRLERLRELGIEPIVGLVHHGSGPRGTSLVDPGFADGLARHAREVATRYPWVTRYTPVNEPLTTARFSGLYGHWYPHGRSYSEFLRALVNQCRAVTLSMDAIRTVTPSAELLQTEDIGRVFSTEALAYQAEHENGRRWLSLDLLFGRVGPDHPWWQILFDHGIAAAELEPFWSARPPDLIGVNHYLTSDRFLDEDLSKYPPHLEGDNGRQRYADAEAIRIPGFEHVTGPAPRLREVAERYRTPLAVTEVHHGCTREEQLRWLRDVWDAACTVRAEGVDLRAVTVWSLFGAVDWNTLLTGTERIYEPGAFDIRGPSPRPTALAHAMAALARTGTLGDSGVAGPGWWRRADRFYDPVLRSTRIGEAARPTLAVIASRGPFADQCREIAERRGWTVQFVSPHQAWPWRAARSRPTVLDASAVEGDVDLDRLRSRLAAVARADGRYAFLSGSVVYPPGPATWLEMDEPSPACPAGLSLAAAERSVRTLCPKGLVVRAGLLFGPGAGAAPASDLEVAPTDAGAGGGRFSYVPDLLHVALDLLIDGENGVRHLVNPAPIADAPLEDGDRAGGSSGVVLGTGKGVLMPPLESALARDRALIRAALPEDGPWLQAAE